MCREQLPVWQRFWQGNGSPTAQLVTIALDAGGPRRPAEFVRQSGLTVPALVDRRAVLARIFGFDVVPNIVWIDRSGGLLYQRYGGADIRRQETVEDVKGLLAESSARLDGHDRQPAKSAERGTELAERGDSLASEGNWAGAANAYREALTRNAGDAGTAFSLGVSLLELGRVDEAADAWCQALTINPDSYVIRKQIWSAQAPDRFYPKIDLEWQRQQMAKEGLLRA